MSDLKTRLPDPDTDWTWYDDDPSVAWDVEESYHGKLGEAYKDAGWERCYHRGSQTWHYNVKVYAPYQELSAAIDKVAADYHIDRDEVAERFNARFEMDLEFWWELDGDYLLSGGHQDHNLGRRDYWQDGRMGGWFEVSDSYARHNAEEMLDLANFLRGSVEYYRSTTWVEDATEMVTMDIEDELAAEKARIERAIDTARTMVDDKDYHGVTEALLGRRRV